MGRIHIAVDAFFEMQSPAIKSMAGVSAKSGSHLAAVSSVLYKVDETAQERLMICDRLARVSGRNVYV